MATLRELATRRSTCLGVVTRHVNGLKGVLAKSPEDSVEEGSALVSKLLEAKRKFDEANEAVLASPECGLQLAEETKSSAGKVTASVVEVLDAHEAWKAGSTGVSVNGGEVHDGQGSAAVDFQAATLDVLMQLQESMARLTSGSVDNAVKAALEEQDRIHQREKCQLMGAIEDLSKQLEKAQLVSNVAAGTAISGHALQDRDGDAFLAAEDKDYRFTSTTYHSRDSSGPIRNRLSGFGRGRPRSTILPRPGRASEGPDDNTSLLMQSLMEQSMLQHKSLVANLQAPKVTIKKFDGNPLEYATFIAAFNDLIHKVVDSDRSRLLQLTEHCTGEAELAISGCAHMDASSGYEQARKTLLEKFGAPHVVTQAWLDKIMGYPALDSGKLLSAFARELVCCRNSLSSLGSLAEIECTGSLRLIVAKLPAHLRAKWRRAVRKKREEGDLRIDILVRLIEDAADDDSDPAFSEEAIQKVKAMYGVKSPNPRPPRLGQPDRKMHVNYAQDEAGIGDTDGPLLDQEAAVYAVARSSCSACRSGQHFTSRCRNFKELGPAERLEFVKSRNLCMLCLSDSHLTDKCPLPWRCQEKTCGQKHHTALHGAFQKAAVNVTELPRDNEVLSAQTYCCVSTTTLPVVRVKVQCGENSRYANALLDTGSTVTMIHQGLVEELEARTKSTGTNFAVKTVTSVEEFEGKLVNIRISPPDQNFKFCLSNAMVVPRVPVSSDCIPRREGIDKWPHLKQLNLNYPDVEDGVQILIGQNNSHLLETGAVVKAQGIWAPYALETPLGWILHGCIEEEADWAGGDVPLSYAIGGSVMVSKVGDILDREPEIEVESGDNPFAGPTAEAAACDELEMLCECGELRDALVSLEGLIKRLADLDEVPDYGQLPADEQLVLDLWERTMTYEDGHIVIPIPFKTDPPQLVNNFNAAYRSLMQLGRYLLAHPDELQQYAAAMFKYFDQGYAEVVKDDNPAATLKAWYLLHMGVKHPRKPGVTRVVKRGDAVYKGCSLNKAAHKGPDLMNSLIGVLIRFRQFRVGTTGDLEGMFNQVWIPEEQRDYERFLFWEDGDPRKKVIVCRMRTHVFGSVWAPAAANFAIKKLAERAEIKDPVVAESIRKEFYVDDWMNSEYSEKRSGQMVRAVREAVAEGSFNMGKFASNSREVLSQIDVQDRAKELAKVNIAEDKLPRSVMLGQHWDPDPDSLVFALLIDPKPFTRRGMTSCISSIFDPLGLLCPFLLPAKVLMQVACKETKGWNDQLQEATAEQWSEWMKEMSEVENFRLRRWFGCDDVTKQFFHIFGDASELSYAAASYLAVMKEHRGTEVGHKEQDTGVSTLVSAKSRVAPTRRLTIPQLEMAGAVLAVKIGQMAMRVFSIAVQAIYYWVDSTIVLVLLHKDPGELKTYMGNRVAFIQQLTDVTQWGHVPSQLNPADIASRGARMSELNNSDLWLTGPDFIRKDQGSWPARTVRIKPKEEVGTQLKKPRPVFNMLVNAIQASGDLVMDSAGLADELRPEEAAMVNAIKVADDTDQRHTADKIWCRYSSWEKTVRFATYMTKFTRYWRAKVAGCSQEITKVTSARIPTVEEIELEELNLIAWAQKFEISADDRLSNSWRKLNPHKKDVWRVGGRFLYAEMPTDEKHPIILPRTGTVTDQIVRQAHVTAGHGGVDRTMIELRRRYWVLGGKVTVKRLTDACIICRKLKARPAEQQMAPLPGERLVKGRPVFWYTGVDLFGPIHVVIKRSQIKRYGALFTCMNTRAVHLEPVEDLTTSAFLDTLERFTDRRGKPRKISSDNGTNFVGADNEAIRAEKMLSDDKLCMELANRRIDWKFNAPSASHQGGVWERLIRSVRSLLVVLTDRKGLSDSRFHTILCMAEAIMNSRPLTCLTEDVTDLDALTPFHFINLQAVRPLFPNKYSADQLRKDWKLSQSLADEFWEQWMGLYIPSLQKRTKWLQERRNVQLNELVLIVNDQYARCEWPLGVITKVHPGKDGLVRNVTVRTQNGYLTRPVQKIVRLEMDVT